MSRTREDIISDIEYYDKRAKYNKKRAEEYKKELKEYDELKEREG